MSSVILLPQPKPTINETAFGGTSCDIWDSPSRLSLQIFILFMIFFNAAATIVIFKVPVNIRGRHVAFLFICVRILNILDLWQCIIIFFSPLEMTKDCVSSPPICNMTGFFFATATIFSPLVAIAMAVDRAIAVYFHLQYKAHPYTKLKCCILGGLLGFYAVYFSLPWYTNFGAYLAVPWLAMCSFEWGVEHRIFNLIIGTITSILSLLLIISNIAIVIKVKRRKRIVEKTLKGSRELLESSSKRVNSNSSTFKPSTNAKSKSLDDLNGKDISPRSTTLSVRRGVAPMKISLRNGSVGKRPTTEKSNSNENLSNTFTIKTPDFKTEKISPLLSNNLHSNGNVSPLAISPPSHETALLYPTKPLSPDDSNKLPHSPLVHEANSKTPRMRTKQTFAGKTFMRIPSNDSILSDGEMVGSPPPALNRLSRHGLNPSNSLMRKSLHASSPVIGKPSATSDDSSAPNTPTSAGSPFKHFFSRQSSANSLLSMASDRWHTMTRRTGRMRKRRKVSRITKMTAAVCTLFGILYIPFLTRKMVQLVPPHYRDVWVPRSVEIITLFLPLLSPLFNPILYVFFNPHYKTVLKRMIRNMLAICKCESLWDAESNRKTNRRKRRTKKSSKKSTTGENSESLSKHAHDVIPLDDVFVDEHNGDISPSDYSGSESKPQNDRRKKSLRTAHLLNQIKK